MGISFALPDCVCSADCVYTAVVRCFFAGFAVVGVGCPVTDRVTSVDTGSVHRCISTYDVAAGYDFVSDGWHTDCPELTDNCAGRTVAAVEAACLENGQDCTGQIALTRGGAGCVTHEQGVARGIDGVVHADLLYSDTHQQPAWVVSNVLVDDGSTLSGERLVIRATDAVVLDRYPWSAKP